MARLGVAAGAAIIGFLIGGPAGASLGWTIGTLIGTLLFPPDPIRGPRLEDLNVQVSSYGVPIPRLYGWNRASGNVIWATDIVETKKKKTAKGGPTTVTYKYYANLTIAICEGPATPFRIWGDSKLLWGMNTVTGAITTEYPDVISYQRGTENDQPSPLHERYDGVGNVPAYRDVLKIDFDLLPLKDFGNHIPNMSVEVFGGVWVQPCSSDIDNLNVIPYVNYDLFDDNDPNAEWSVDEDLVCVDYEQRRLYMLAVVYDGPDAATWVITLDLDTYEEIRRVKSYTLVELDATEFAGESYGGGWAPTAIEGTDWIAVIVQTNSPYSPDISGQLEVIVNTITGAWTAISSDNYPLAWNEYDDDLASHGWHTYINRMGKRIGNSNKALVISLWQDDGFVDWAHGMTANLWLVNSSSGSINHIASGDFGKARNFGYLGNPLNPYNYTETYPDWVIWGDNTDNAISFYYEHHDATETWTPYPPDTYYGAYPTYYITKVTVTTSGNVSSELVATWQPGNPVIDGRTFYIKYASWGLPYADAIYLPDENAITVLYLLQCGDVAPTSERWYEVAVMRKIFLDGGADEVVYTEVNANLVTYFDPNIDTFRPSPPYYGNMTYNNAGKQFVGYMVDRINSWQNYVYVIDASTLTYYKWFHTLDLGARVKSLNPNLSSLSDANAGRFVFEEAFLDPTRCQSIPLWLGWDSVPATWDNFSVINFAMDFTSPSLTVKLKDIVKDINERCQMTEGPDFDVTALTDDVMGYALTRQMSGRQAIEPLQQVYFFDGIETQGKLTWKYRDNPTVKTIVEKDLGTRPFGGARIDRLVDTRQQELELPFRVTIRYADPERNYQSGSQYFMRHRNAQRSDQILSVDVPMTLRPDDAKQVARRILYISWQYRTSYEFQLPRSYIELDPGDVIDVPYNNTVSTIYITEIDYGTDGLLKFKGQSHDELVYLDTGDLGTSVIVPPEDLGVKSPMVVEFVDGPLVIDYQDDYSGFVVAAEGLDQDPDSNWPGGELYRSVTGTIYETLVTVYEESIIGESLTELTDQPHTLLDRVNVLRVQIDRGTLASTDFRSFMNGTNLFMLGEELCAFMIATQVSAGVYDLSILRRGLQGSSWATSTHSTYSERFIYLDIATNVAVIINPSEVGIERNYKALTFGYSLDEVNAVQFKPLNVHFKPIAPSHLRGVRDGPLNLTITWIRCARKDHEWKDITDSPLDEPIERYILRVYNGATVVREEIIDTVSTYVYTAANQTTDFGSTQSAIDIQVCQYSTRVGNGYFISRTL